MVELSFPELYLRILLLNLITKVLILLLKLCQEIILVFYIRAKVFIMLGCSILMSLRLKRSTDFLHKTLASKVLIIKSIVLFSSHLSKCGQKTVIFDQKLFIILLSAERCFLFGQFLVKFSDFRLHFIHFLPAICKVTWMRILTFLWVLCLQVCRLTFSQRLSLSLA